ncbi:reverse transcriptase domain-containing protein [Tanacetum coccineum]
MAKLLQAPTEGYRDAIVIPAILAENFELKHGLLNLVTSKQFCGFEKEDPHAHIRWFNKITSTIKYKDVPNVSIKLMLFPFSTEGAARIWVEKEPPHSILTWEDLVSKFINQFFPPSKTTNLRNEITNLQQRFDESFCEAWDRFKDLLRACPHHDFTELHQLDTFYNSLTSTDQDLLNAAAGGNLLTKTPKDALTIIENKSKVRTSRNRPVVAKVSTNTSTSSLSPDVATLTDVVKALLLKNTTRPPAFVKAVEESCVTYGGPYPYYQCLATDGNAFPEIVECLALANLGASINLMPLSIWRKLSLPELTPTQMILELEDRSTTRPTGIAEDVFVRVGKFHFPADFVIVDYVIDPRVPLIPGRHFLRMARALIDVYGEELTLRVSDEAITFKVSNTSRYSYNDVESINRIDVIDIACEEYSHKVLGFSNNSESGNPTLISKPIIAKSLPSLTLFEGCDFILEEIEACFASDSVPPGIDDAEFDPEGDIRLIEEMLNNDPYSPLPPKDLKFKELKTIKSSVNEPSELELKDLPSHLEYAFLEGTDKLPVIIVKNLKDEEKERLIKVLKSHKQAIAWKISDIKGIDPQFCTHKILMEDDFKLAVQHQRRVNLKIHEVIKKEVVKLLDARLIYPISDSLWVSPVHCVPKKGGMTIVTNENNELISTRFSGYFQIPIDPQDQEKTTFSYPYETFAYRRMHFGLCNAPGTFQRCMMAIFYDMIEETIEVFMDDFSVFGDSFSSCLSHLDKMLKSCEDTNLVLNWEKCHFMVKEGIVIGNKILKSRIEVDRAKVDVIAKLPPPTSVKGIQSFLSHAGFIVDLFKIFLKSPGR